MTIKEICEKYQLRQTELARRFNIPLRSVQNWYSGVRNPPEYLPKMIDKLLTYESSNIIIENNENQFNKKREQ